MARSFAAAVVLVAVLPSLASESGFSSPESTPHRTLTFEDRVAAQRVIEEVYWRHQIWPKDNLQPKPPRSRVIADEAIRAKVVDYLEESNLLETWWHRRITAEQLQAEMDRMSRSTRSPEILRELFAALGNDPLLVAETLARPILADRLVRNWYANDARLHAGVRKDAARVVAQARSIAEMRAVGALYSEMTVVPRREASEGREGDGQQHRVSLDAEEWTHWMRSLASLFGVVAVEEIPLQRPSSLQEGQDRYFVTALLARKNDEVTVATVEWRKKPFETWWAEQRTSIGTQVETTTGSFVLSSPAAVACAADTWRSALYVPDARFGATSVWTGTEMIVWGGQNLYGAFLDTGGRYNPSTDTWLPTSFGVNAPSARAYHTAIWTGTTMIVWGGHGPSSFNTGGLYDPTNDTWLPTSTGTNVPPARSYHTAVWTGTEMIVWGGSGVDAGNTGGRYHPATDTWISTSTGTNVPEARIGHTAVWTGTEMLVWGGERNYRVLNTGGRYRPATDTWTATSTGTGAPEGRDDHTAVWTGTEMIIWGGLGSASMGFSNTGGRYDPATDTWTPTSVASNVPTARGLHTAVWTGAEMVVWGGASSGPRPDGDTNSGGRYDPSTDTWVPTSIAANVPARRSGHSAVWTNREMIVWGGGWESTGGRYDPSTDSWVPTSTGAIAPSQRYQHTVVWTGTEMIVWGGTGLFGNSIREVNTGGRYDSATDAWSPTSSGANVPAARSQHTAVWTGTEMIVWGGSSASGSLLDTGGRYSPSADTWSPTSTGTDVPTARSWHTAVWTGTEMIVWGGSSSHLGDALNTGGRYSPSTDTWSPSSTGTDVPTARYRHTAVWTGTEVIVWGGSDSSGDLLKTGGRYTPAATDSWLSTSMGEDVPSEREGHTAVWTGKEMIVWGGGSDSGGRYAPSSDSWWPMSEIDTGSGHTAVWTGTTMIVWGGYEYDYATRPPSVVASRSGGQYDPSADMWWPTSVEPNRPSARTGHTAVWTGTEMIVWGGLTGTHSDYVPASTALDLYCACQIFRTFYQDADGDGHGNPDVVTTACAESSPSGWVTNGADCNDLDPAIAPSAVDVCNGVDDDCDGTIDDDGSTLCEDGNLCTTDACHGASGCSHSDNAAPCDDLNACTTSDVCANGACVGGPPPDCEDENVCTADTCNSQEGCRNRSVNVDTTSFSTDRIDGRDLVILAGAWHSLPSQRRYRAAVDLDQIPGVDIGDFGLFMLAFGRSCP